MAGRTPKPTAMKVLQGNPGKRPLNRREPSFSAEGLSCPRWLTGLARLEWKRVVPLLKEQRLVTAADRVTVEAYCVAYANWRKAEAVLEERGFVMKIETKGGGTYEQQRPEVAIAQKYYTLMLTAGGRLGFDPSSRTRLQVPEAPAEDPFGAFLKGQEKASRGG